jgi:opacity protein-like surface antigen
MNRRPIPILVLGALIAALPSLAAAGTDRGHWGETQALRLHLGEFTPRGDSEYWTDKEIDFSGSADDFAGGIIRLEYLRYLGERLGLLASGGYYEGSSHQFYLDFVDESGRDITHRTALDVGSVTVGLLAHPFGRDKVVSPYVGVGAGFYSWRLRESGDFIDFGPVPPEIFTDSFRSNGTTFGWYYQVGLEVPVARNFAVEAEARWERADAELEDDFQGFGNLDLSGRALTLGVSWSF